MARSVAPMDDRQIVASMRARKTGGFAAAYDAYAERLYAYSRSILSDHDAAADAVHDAFLIAGQRIGELRNPDRLRPWLYAIVRHECLRQLRTRRRHVELTEAGEVQDDSVDLDAGLRTEQYRELIWAAAEGLNPRDREVLELSVRHGLEGADLAAALGVSTNQAHALMSRARQQLERALTVVVVARTGRRDCTGLDALLTGWDGVLTALWRKRIARHIEHCPACGGTKRREVRATALLATVPFVALPIALRDRVLTAMANPQLVAYHTDLATRAGQFNHDGFPRSAAAARHAGLAAPRRVALPSAAAVLVLAAVLLFLHGPVSQLLAISNDSTASTATSATIPAGSQQTPINTEPDIQFAPQIINQPPGPNRPPGPPASQPPVFPHRIIAVPNLLGLSQQRAQQTLQTLGLTLGTVASTNAAPPNQIGLVIDQSPSSGVTVQPGSPVALTVARAPQPMICPPWQERHGNSCEPVRVCPDGQERHGDSCARVCPDGQERHGDSCARVCPDGQELHEGSCARVCPDGQELHGSSCARVCPSGQEPHEGTCRPVQTTRCPSGQEPHEGTCRPVQTIKPQQEASKPKQETSSPTQNKIKPKPETSKPKHETTCPKGQRLVKGQCVS